MKLYHFNIQGFRKHYCTDIRVSDTTFLIGENNIGKSSVLAALEYFLSDTKKIPESEYFSYLNEEGNNECVVDKIVLTAEFHNVPEEALRWRGFKGRVLKYTTADGLETGLKIVYRKTYRKSGECEIALLSYPRQRKECYAECKSINDFIQAGVDEEEIVSILGGLDKVKPISKKELDKLSFVNEIWEIDESTEEWILNPGGIPGVVLSKLPKYLLIPAQDKMGELSENNGTLVKALKEMFDEVRDASDNFKKAQEYLNLLAQELDPTDTTSELGEMMNELNGVLGEVFPKTGISAIASLSKPEEVIKPLFHITMYSNVNTEVGLQGTGMIRAGVFALLRYKTKRDLKRKSEGTYVRPLIIGFEEPEIYLHPNAAMQMRETIYNLSESDSNQIVCTTHSPYMIDLNKKPNQLLNNLTEKNMEIEFGDKNYDIVCINSIPFNVTAAFKHLQSDDKQYLKMLLKVDSDVSRIFFSPKVLIVEGDTELIVIREAIARMEEEDRKNILSNWTIIRARGKAIIISLIKYLTAMGIEPVVMHDKDTGVERAECFNEPIKQALGNDNNLFVVENCIEDILGYAAPSSEKPFKAYKYIESNWGETWDDIPNTARTLFEEIFFGGSEISEAMMEVAVTQK